FLEGFEAIVAAVLQDDFDASSSAEPLHGGRAEDIDARFRHFGAEALLKGGSDRFSGEFSRGAVIEVRKHQVQGAEIWSVGIEQNRLARNGYGVAHARCFASDLLDALHD